MTTTEIAKSLFDGSICPEEAKANIMREYEIDCQRAVKRWAYQWDTIRLCGRRLMDYAEDTVEMNYNGGCLKAGFFAALYSKKDECFTDEIETTQCDFDAFDCRLGTRCENGTCTRIETGIGGDRYDNCPSIHAAQWLRIFDGDRPSDLLWMEAGAVFNGERYELANGPSDNPFDRVYRCSMCLKTMLGKGIVDLCNVGLDKYGNISITIAPIAATLNTLVLLNCADMLSAKSGKKSC